MAKQKSSDPFPGKFNADSARKGIDPIIVPQEKFDRGLEQLDRAMNKQADLKK